MAGLRPSSVTARLAISTALAVMTAIAAGMWIYSLGYPGRLLEPIGNARWVVGAAIALTVLLIAGLTLIGRLVVLRPMAASMAALLDQVRGEQQRLATVINSIDDGIVVLDPARKVLAANDAFLRRTGRTREHVLGACCVDVGPGECVDCPAVACVDARSRQVRICERAMADGTTRWEEVHASPVIGTSGELTQVVEVWRDISERRVAEARLSESHRLASLGMLASGFSHELNTPLATVLMCVEGILRETADTSRAAMLVPQIKQRATVAREQVLRCRGITQHFLRLSRGQQPAPAILDLAETVSAAARLVAPTAKAHSVRIQLPDPTAGLHVRADEAELQHVVINLLLNAIQASPDGSEVAIDLAPGDPLSVRVIDRGCGIEPALQARIFEPFFSLRHGGTGLGLFLSLNFARRWGGNITVGSRAGQGATFTVTIPPADLGEQRRTA
jgi:two-component system, NtrC family, sensor histidine kinase HydH